MLGYARSGVWVWEAPPPADPWEKDNIMLAAAPAPASSPASLAPLPDPVPDGVDIVVLSFEEELHSPLLSFFLVAPTSSTTTVQLSTRRREIFLRKPTTTPYHSRGVKIIIMRGEYAKNVQRCMGVNKCDV